MKTQEYFLGIDGGGTKCKARLESFDGRLLAEATAGPANVARDIEQAMHSVVEASKQAIANAGLTIDVLCEVNAGIGLAGLNIPSVYDEFSTKPLPFKRHCATTDLNIARLGAHEGKDGGIIIVGTGSSAAVSVNNKETVLGGHGFLLGDQGSGAWVGKQAVTDTLLELDGLLPKQGFSQGVLHHFNCSDKCELVSLLSGAMSSKFASIAPKVIEWAKAEQPNALSIIKQAASYIDNLVIQVMRHQPERLSMIGGLAEPIQAFLSDQTKQSLSPALMSPEQGAIVLIKSQTGISSK